jgi:hypothetical protein
LVTLIRVLPHQRVAIGDPHHSELVVALDSDVLANEEGKGAGKSLHSGDFVWLGQDKAAQVFNKSGDKEARIILFTLNSRGTEAVSGMGETGGGQAAAQNRFQPKQSSQAK